MAPHAPLHRRYRALVARIEQGFAVSRWRYGDLDLWPLARMDLFLDMLQAEGVDVAPPGGSALEHIARRLATPLSNLWRSRRDLAHWAPWPRRAHAILLGDGVTLDRLDRAWRDRYGEPVIAAFERRGKRTFLMQGGDFNRSPWARPTFAANGLAVWAWLCGPLGGRTRVDLPDHDAVLRLLQAEGVDAPSLDRARLARRAREASAAAWAFERVLQVVRPKLAFVVTWWAGLGPAFALACRRRGVLCVDLQRGPQETAQSPYRWAAVPPAGYTSLPSAFWTWTEADAARIRGWSAALAAPWHRSLCGGHAQLAPFLDDDDPRTRAWDAAFAAVDAGRRHEREVLIALQPVGGHRATWAGLAAAIAAAPAHWRWWIRRHPASAPHQEAEFAPLLALNLPNVKLAEASALPLPALLRHMSAVVSLCSGAALEAAAFGAPALFLSAEAEAVFGDVIARGAARLVEPAEVVAQIEALPKRPARAPRAQAPQIATTLAQLEALAEDYARLCAGLWTAPARRGAGRARTSTPGAV